MRGDMWSRQKRGKMARKKYVPGALVCSRNSIYEKGMGIILSVGGWPHAYDPEVKCYTVHWFDKPGHVDRWKWQNSIRKKGKFVCGQTINQIKLLKPK